MYIKNRDRQSIRLRQGYSKHADAGELGHLARGKGWVSFPNCPAQVANPSTLHTWYSPNRVVWGNYTTRVDQLSRLPAQTPAERVIKCVRLGEGGTQPYAGK